MAAQSEHEPVKFNRNPSRATAQRETRGARSHALDDEATILYIKRVLHLRQDSGSRTNSAAEDLSSEPLEQLLPPLTSSNAVDIQLYAFIAVILHLFVQTWYNRITPDQEFVGQVVQIIAHCTRGLEQRLRRVDLESLLLDELPGLVREHIQAVRIAQLPWRGRPSSLVEEIRFHSLRPHIALEPVAISPEAQLKQQENMEAWSILVVNRVLPLLLPPEDLQNPCLDVLVSEIFSEMIIRGGICGKASEPWLIWEGVTKLIYSMKLDAQRRVQPSLDAKGRSEQSWLSSSHQPSTQHDTSRGRQRRFDAIVLTFWSFVQLAITSLGLLRALVTALMQAPSSPARSARTAHVSKLPEGAGGMMLRASPDHTLPSHMEDVEGKPIFGMQVWPLLSDLLLLDRRMPWLSGVLSLMQWLSLFGPGKLCKTNGGIDRLASSHIHQTLVSANWLPGVLQATRSALFPDNTLAQSRVPPTDDETLKIKKECASAILDTIPLPLRMQFFATRDEGQMKEDIEVELLDLLASPYINRHLIVCMVELLMARLFPELTTVGESRFNKI